MPTIRMRYSGPLESAPMIGGYILSASRPRGGYLITGVRNLGRRGGLGEPVHYALVIENGALQRRRHRSGPGLDDPLG